MNFRIRFFFFTLAILFLSACGEGSRESSSSSSITYTGYIIDSPVVNLEYRCGTKVAKTEAGGLFTCTSLPVKFFLGNLEIGEVSGISSDSKIFIQDIVGLARDNFTDTEVIKLGLFLQSLSTNADISTEILLPDTIIFTTTQNFEELNLEDIRDLLVVQGVTLRTEEEVSEHLQESAEVAPNLTNATAVVGTMDIAIASTSFSNAGGTVDSCIVSPRLPTGLSLGSDCTISGTASTVHFPTIHTVRGSNGSGSDTASVIITINSLLFAPSLSNAPSIVTTTGVNIGSRSFLNTGGTIDSCTVSPTLPTGLSLGSDCTITGTATTSQPASIHTVTGANEGGSDTATVSITVNETDVITPTTATISGTITFDSVPFKSGGSSGLD